MPTTCIPATRAVRRVAMLSFHTSPLAALGGRVAGGMNVYVREVASRLGDLGIAVDVFTRRVDPDSAPVVGLAPRVRLVQVEAGPAVLVEKEDLPEFVLAFARGVEAFRRDERISYDLVHSHYWLSTEAGDSLARWWDVPHAAMFHTLGD